MVTKRSSRSLLFSKEHDLNTNNDDVRLQYLRSTTEAGDRRLVSTRRARVNSESLGVALKELLEGFPPAFQPGMGLMLGCERDTGACGRDTQK